METVIGLLLAASPVILTVALLLGAERRQRRVQAEVERQIALTDALHGRLGARVAPVVRRRGSTWRVSVAVPVEEPAIGATVLATVDEMFGPGLYELQMRQQGAAVSAEHTRGAARPVGALSWT